MRTTVVRNGDEQAEFGLATSLLRSVLAGVPATLGKLAWISACRARGSERYVCDALHEVVPAEIAADAARREHERLFFDWLGMDLQEKHKDLVEYLEALGDSGEQKAFLRREWERLVPRSARKPDRLFFETDLSVVLELTEELPSAGS